MLPDALATSFQSLFYRDSMVGAHRGVLTGVPPDLQGGYLIVLPTYCLERCSLQVIDSYLSVLAALLSSSGRELATMDDEVKLVQDLVLQ
jgi:hypothetical protein